MPQADLQVYPYLASIACTVCTGYQGVHEMLSKVYQVCGYRKYDSRLYGSKQCVFDALALQWFTIGIALVHESI